jgi:nucleotide-binding universal stress UspA family protein
MGETVVVGYDGHQRSDRALDRAIETVKAEGGRLIVVVAEELPPTQNPLLADLGPYDAGAYGYDPAISLPDLEHPLPGVQEAIDRARERVAGTDVSAECIWGIGDPAQVIVDTANEHDASKIMIGAHHHGFFERLFGPDIDAEVRRAARCEVVLVEES